MSTFGLLIGTYTDPGYAPVPGDGVYAATCRDGVVGDIRLAAGLANPSWLTWVPERAVAYCVSELADGALVGVGLAPERRGDPFGSAPTGADPAHVAITPDGRFAITADYTGGSVTTVPIDAGGRLGPASDRRLMSELITAAGGPSHPHFIGFDPLTGAVVVADLGLDRIVFLEWGAAGLGDPTDVLSLPSGCGPRRLLFSPEGERLFVLGELDATVSAFRRAGRGFELEAHVSTVPDAAVRRSAAELLMSEDGGVLYATNRGDDSIAILDARDALRLVATVPAEVRTPRGAALTPDGHLLVAGQGDGRIVSFSLDDPYRPRPLTEAAVPAPVCIQVVATDPTL